MRIPLDRQSGTPLYSQIEQFLRQQIQSGALGAETRLPASRELASGLGISRMTAVNAYAELEAEGLIYTLHGSGTFVAPQLTMLTPENGRDTDSWPQWQHDHVQQARVPLRETYERQLDKYATADTIYFTDGMGVAELFSTDDFRKTLQTVMRRDGADALVQLGGNNPSV